MPGGIWHCSSYDVTSECSDALLQTTRFRLWGWGVLPEPWVSSFFGDKPHERVGEKPPSFWASGVQVESAATGGLGKCCFKNDLGLGFPVYIHFRDPGPPLCESPHVLVRASRSLAPKPYTFAVGYLRRSWLRA